MPPLQRTLHEQVQQFDELRNRMSQHFEYVDDMSPPTPDPPPPPPQAVKVVAIAPESKIFLSLLIATYSLLLIHLIKTTLDNECMLMIF